MMGLWSDWYGAILGGAVVALIWWAGETVITNLRMIERHLAQLRARQDEQLLDIKSELTRLNHRLGRES